MYNLNIKPDTKTKISSFSVSIDSWSPENIVLSPLFTASLLKQMLDLPHVGGGKKQNNNSKTVSKGTLVEGVAVNLVEVSVIYQRPL